MSKLYVTSTLVMLGYAVIIKIITEIMWVIRQMWVIQEAMSMRQLWILQIMDSAKETMIFVGWALFIFLLVNVIVEHHKEKQSIASVAGPTI
jgi:hypothetical protein